VNTNKFTVTAATGNTAVAGTLTATGQTNADGGLRIGGAGNAVILDHFSATASWNPGTINSNACGSTTITVTGAALGDTVLVARGIALNSASWQLTGYVSAANTVTVSLCNSSGSNADGGANDTYRADVWHH
jgi:hypothetical protein